MTRNPKCWRDCLSLEKTCDRFLVCQNNCWLCFFPENGCKMKKCQVDCQKFFKYMGILCCSGGKFFQPNATGVYVFRFDCIFWSGLSSIMRAYPALLKLASDIRTRCFPGIDGFNVKWQASLRALLTESNMFINSDVMLIGTSVLKNLWNGFSFSVILGI